MLPLSYHEFREWHEMFQESNFDPIAQKRLLAYKRDIHLYADCRYSILQIVILVKGIIKLNPLTNPPVCTIIVVNLTPTNLN
jgi:hypothetical protein